MLSRLANALLFCLLTQAGAMAADNHFNWANIGAEARERGLPVAILIMDPDCEYCERLRQEFLEAPATRGTLEKGTITQEISREEGGKVTDFDGERIRTQHFLARYGIFATPTLLLLSPEGEMLAPALVGFNGAQAYGDQVAKRMKSARDNLASGARPSRSMLADSE
jgi:thioredoxin-related protein